MDVNLHLTNGIEFWKEKYRKKQGNKQEQVNLSIFFELKIYFSFDLI